MKAKYLSTQLGDGEFEDQFVKKELGGTTVFLERKICTCFMIIS